MRIEPLLYIPAKNPVEGRASRTLGAITQGVTGPDGVIQQHIPVHAENGSPTVGQSVGKIGSPSILPQLDDLEERHQEEAVREGAKEAADEIKERSGAKRN